MFSKSGLTLYSLAFSLALAPVARGADPAAPAVGDEARVALNFPDNVELKTVIEYVSDRLGVNILYDEQTVNQRITIRTPAEVPRSSLLGLLDSALKMKGFALVDGEQPGWKRVIAAANMAQAAVATTRPGTADPAAAGVVTQVFSLACGDVARADLLVKPFLSQPGGNSLALPDQRLLIVTDYQSNARRIGDLIRLVDQPSRGAADVRFVPVRHVDASQVAGQVSQLVAAKLRLQSTGAAANPSAAQAVEVVADARTNRLALIGAPELLGEAEALVRQVDVPLDVQTRFYTLRSVSPERIDRLSRDLIGPADPAKLYQSVVDRDSNMLVVTGTPEMQQRVATMIESLDVASAAAQSPIRFYKLNNATAGDVLETIQAISGENAGGPAGSSPRGGAASQGDGSSAAFPLYAGGNRPPAAAGQQSPTPPAYSGGSGQGGPANAATYGTGSSANTGQAPVVPGSTAGTAGGAGQEQQRVTVRTKDATVTADPNTNTIIVVAPPATQTFYEQMIRSLDRRRPQVLLECTIVTLDTTNDFSLGVELGGDTRTGNANLVTFSAFGLSTPNAANGRLAIVPGTGFNAALLKPDVGSMVIHALADSGRSEVFSAPKILVNDNATGTLSSVSEAPFTSVNASQTVSTTSFAGYASAGTTVTLTPHISEADHLNLEYTVELNSFTGAGGQGIPPPRQTDSVTSKVTIPDGDVIVVGGLNRRNTSDTQSGVPLLRLIPVLKYLFSSNNRSEQRSSLFVFLRPVILRDDQFEDLKYYSRRDARDARVDDGLPKSEPLLVE